MVYRSAVSLVTILGSGTCVPSLKRSSCSILFETGGEKLLFDAGAGTMRRLLEAGIHIFDLSYIFLSHFHPDHTAEIVPLLFATKYPDASARKKPLKLAGGRGLIYFFNGLKKAHGHWIDLPANLFGMFEFDNTASDRHDFGRFYVETTPMKHNPESVAYRIRTSEGKTLVYSGDTDYCENLVDLAKNADLFICEASFPDALKRKGHLTPSLAGDLAAKAGVSKLVLIHFYPECDTADLRRECRRTFDGPLVLATDLQRLEL